MGLAQLFSTTAFNINLYLIIAQNIWVLAAAITLATTNPSDRVTASGLSKNRHRHDEWDQLRNLADDDGHSLLVSRAPEHLKHRAG